MKSDTPPGLRRAATRSTFLLTGTNLFTYAVSIASTLVLARLLSPRQFGEVVLAVVISEFIFLLAGWSLSIALIREPEATVELAFDTSIILMCWSSAAVAAVSAVIAIAMLHWYSATLALVFVAISASRILVLFTLLFLADLERRLSFGRFAIAHHGSTLLSVGAAIALGYGGAGVWALASRDIVSGCAGLAMAVLFSRWRPQWSYNRTKARELLRFGTGMLGSRLGDLLFHRFDNLMVGTLAGSHQLGLYNQSYILAEVGIKAAHPAIYQVSMPTYARLQGDRSRSSSAYRFVVFFLSRAVVPVAILFVVIPGQLLGVVLGDQWRPAENMLRALAVYALLIPLVEHTRIVLIANGAIREALLARLIQVSFFVPAAVVAAWLWGGDGTAVVVALAVILGGAAVYYFARRLVDIPLRDFIAPAVAGLIASAILVLISRTLSGDAVVLVVGTALATGSFVAALFALEWARLMENLSTLIGALRGVRGEDVPLASETDAATMKDVARVRMTGDGK